MVYFDEFTFRLRWKRLAVIALRHEENKKGNTILLSDVVTRGNSKRAKNNAEVCPGIGAWKMLSLESKSSGGHLGGVIDRLIDSSIACPCRPRRLRS